MESPEQRHEEWIRMKDAATPLPERVAYWSDATAELLEAAFGIDDLSVNERFIIKKIAEDVVERENPKTDSGFSVDREIATRFLVEAYGLDPYVMNKQTKTDEEAEQFMEYIRRTRDRAHLI